ncbi:hypothetical protein LA080_011323 [Diaporthe eres]|uniref:Uncharacterized protein n=1 Tax=Diaporthe vaccinii TaxID=105482 RepID=A0ABR4DP99_9PEZI|nr:hypothetical protein LA080_011323 [Diaporthe eres]
MVSMKKKNSPSKAGSHQDSSDVSPQPRLASGTLPPHAAHAPEFVPGEAPQPSVSDQKINKQQGEQKTSEASSDKETAPRKKAKKTKEPTKAEKEAEEKAQKEQAMDEEWWSGDEIFAPNLKQKDDLWNNGQI